MKMLRHLWESIIYVGMKPGSAASPSRIPRLFGPLRGPVERFLAGGVAPTDPLYLTNRTFGQKLRTAVVVSIPCLIVVGLVALGVRSYFSVSEKPVRDLTAAELKEKILPNLAQNIHIATNHDLEVTEARVERGQPTMVLGAVKNNTDHAIENARVVFDLTSNTGARLGAVAADIARVDAKSTAPFRIAVEQDTAAYALVREVVLQ
jgi:hypothetical protein